MASFGEKVAVVTGGTVSANGGVIINSNSESEILEREKRYENMQRKWTSKLQSRKTDQSVRKSAAESEKDPAQCINNFTKTFKVFENDVLKGLQAAEDDVKNEVCFI